MKHWPHRTYCDTIEEARKCLSTISIFNYRKVTSVISCLLEECQVYGNRMEAGLEYGEDLNSLHKKRKKLEEEIEGLKREKKLLSNLTLDSNRDRDICDWIESMEEEHNASL